MSTEEEIMEATYRVLVNVGYSELSMRQIAEEFDGSQSLIYYHYDDKEALLVGFLEYLVDAFEAELDAIAEDDPVGRLHALTELVLPPATDTEQLQFQQALGEVRVQIPHHERYRPPFDELDTTLETELHTAIERGLATGAFTGVDPEDGAEKLSLLLYGVIDRYVPTRDWEGIERGKALIESEIDAWR